MKITIVQGAFLPVPPLRGGAIEKAWFGLGREFARRGHEVTHLSRQFPGLPSDERIDGVRHFRVPGFDYPKSAVFLKLRDLAYARRVLPHLPSADILVTHTFWLPILAARRNRGLVYVHVARFPKRQMALYRGAARLQAVSTAVANAIREQTPAAASRVRTIPLPLPEGAFPSSIPGSHSKTILYAGRIHPEKGLELLIRALLQTGLSKDGWRLRLVGPHKLHQGGAGDDYLSHLKSIADRHVEFVPPIFEQSKLREEYGAASLFVYPSLAERGETFGLAPLEAMACACPALVSKLECFADFIDDGRNGWTFDHRSSDPVAALSAKLSSILQAPEELCAFGQAARATAADFTLDKVAPRYLADFESLLKEQRAST